MILAPPSALSRRHVYPIRTRLTNLQQTPCQYTSCADPNSPSWRHCMSDRDSIILFVIGILVLVLIATLLAVDSHISARRERDKWQKRKEEWRASYTEYEFYDLLELVKFEF